MLIMQYADSNDVVFNKMIDYDLNGDSDTLMGNLYVLRGIATLKNDVIINGSIPFTRSKPNTVSSQYYYQNGDTNLVEKYGFYHIGSGYGTYINGLAVSKDSFAFTSITYQTSTRIYNFTQSLTSPARGSFIPPAFYGQEVAATMVRECRQFTMLQCFQMATVITQKLHSSLPVIFSFHSQVV